MEGRPASSLTTTRAVVAALYFAGVVVYPLIGVVAAPDASHLPAQTVRLLGPVFLAVGIADYILSLVVEQSLLGVARKRAQLPQAIFMPAIIVAGFGESLSILGLILSFLGAKSWALPLYVLCFMHGVHLASRWPRYRAAAAGEDEL
jgi:F0F1-type ATP synthase membrane subunit c/vacuolar-type H+-ATPase subunit K